MEEEINPGIQLRNIVISIVLILFLFFLAYHFLIARPDYTKDSRYVENVTTLQECKFKYWVDCGLKPDDKMCWQLKGNVDENYTVCQLIKEKEKDCWQESLLNCMINFGV